MATTPVFGEIYVHICTANGKSYVGQTTAGVSRRWGKHLTAARLPHHPGYNSLIAKAIRKYGAAAFEHQTLSVARSAQELDNLEKVWIILLQTKPPLGYNLQAGGSLWTPERLARMSARKREFSPAGRAALVCNGQTRRGCKQSPEAIAKTAAANRGRVKSPAERAKLSTSLQGHILSAATRAKISASTLGRKDSVASCAKKSASKSTPEARAANSARVKAQWAARKAAQSWLVA
jgi:group I intron endonuclease